MYSSARMSNLQAILADDEDIRHVVINAIGTLETIEREDIRRFRRASLLDPTTSTYLPNPSATAFQLAEAPY